MSACMRASHCSKLMCAKPYFYSAKSSSTTIHSVGASENRKIELLARTRRQSVRRCEIYVLRVCPTLMIFVDDLGWDIFHNFDGFGVTLGLHFGSLGVTPDLGNSSMG